MHLRPRGSDLSEEAVLRGGRAGASRLFVFLVAPRRPSRGSAWSLQGPGWRSGWRPSLVLSTLRDGICACSSSQDAGCFPLYLVGGEGHVELTGFLVALPPHSPEPPRVGCPSGGVGVACRAEDSHSREFLLSVGRCSHFRRLSRFKGI